MFLTFKSTKSVLLKYKICTFECYLIHAYLSCIVFSWFTEIVTQRVTEIVSKISTFFDSGKQIKDRAASMLAFGQLAALMTSRIDNNSNDSDNILQKDQEDLDLVSLSELKTIYTFWLTFSILQNHICCTFQICTDHNIILNFCYFINGKKFIFAPKKKLQQKYEKCNCWYVPDFWKS